VQLVKIKVLFLKVFLEAKMTQKPYLTKRKSFLKKQLRETRLQQKVKKNLNLSI
jgi:hypothetical protein